MKVVTYNILTGGIERCGDRRKHVRAALREISARSGPSDIVALQEAMDFDGKNRRFKEEIQEDLGLRYAYVSDARKHECDGRRHNTAIYSQWPLEEVCDFHGQVNTAGLFAVVNAGELGRVAVISAHLHYLDEDARMRELDIMLPHMEPFGRRIIMGDFNSLNENDEYKPRDIDEYLTGPDGKKGNSFAVLARLERDGYRDAQGPRRGRTLEEWSTYPSTTNDNTEMYAKPVRLDYILARGLQVRAAGAVHSDKTEKASDHRPVCAILE